MRLSIFNSKSWWLTWLLTIGLLLALFGGYEYCLYRAGYPSSVTENQDLWAWHRQRAKHTPNNITIVGASRIQLGLNTDVLRAHFPNKTIIGLTLNGRYPLSTFEHLANDESFTGTVIVSLVAQSLEPVYWDMQREYIEHFETSSWYQRSEAWLRAKLQHHFRLLNAELNWRAIFNSFTNTGHYPKRPHVKVLPDLSKQIDYSQQDKAALTAGFVAEKAQNYQDQPPMSADIWQQQVKKVSRLVEKIYQRGGKVIIIRMPTDKGHWDLDERYYPHQQFWRDIAAIPHVQAIHFKEYPALAQFNLADSSHLDKQDAVTFTQALLSQLSIQ